MLPNRVSFIFTHFKNIRFSVSSSLIAQIFMAEKYEFFFLLHEMYSYVYLKSLRSFYFFFLKSFSPHWVRVAFKGKGYRLRKFRDIQKITMNFGHSHWAKLLITEGFFFKKFRRQNYICLLESYYKLQKFKYYIKFIKKLNSYTKRGLRLRKQYIRKRFGKISQVVSSLH